MKKTPEIWRKKRGGKYYGSWYVTINKTDICLSTQSAVVARELVPEAMRGRRNFDTDAQAAAAAMDAGGAEAAAAQSSGASEPSPAPTPVAAAAPPPPAPEQPPAPPAPPPATEDDARAEAEATNAAAAATTASSPTSPVAANDNGFKMDPAAIRGLLATGAEAMVELQLSLQAWVIKRKTGKEPGLIPADAAIRKIGVECWTAQFLRWFPDLDDVPPWILAVGVVGACAPYQLANAKVIPKESEKPAESETKAAA